MSEWIHATNLGELSEEESVVIDVAGVKVAVFLFEGEYYAMADTCPHQTAPLSEGIILKGRVRCPLHASYFDLKTGEVSGGPCKKNVQIYEVHIEGESVRIKSK